MGSEVPASIARPARAFAMASHIAALDPHAFDGMHDSVHDAGDGHGAAGSDPRIWLDEERFEDWQRPTLDVLCPDVHIALEEELFPVAVAEDGETLPSELHPSHPYGDLHAPGAAFAEPARQSSQSSGAHAIGKPGDGSSTTPHARGRRDLVPVPAAPPLSERVLLRSRQTTSANRPHWPFRRFGPGHGGPLSLARAEASRPWRPYRMTWSDNDLQSLAQLSAGLTRDPLEERRNQQRRRERWKQQEHAIVTPPPKTHAQQSTARAADKRKAGAATMSEGDVQPWRPQGPESLLREIDSLSAPPSEDGDEDGETDDENWHAGQNVTPRR